MKPLDGVFAISSLAALAFSSLAAESDKPAVGSDRVWCRLDVPAGENCFALTFDPANPQRALLGTRPGSLWESLDGGRTFARKETAIESTASHGVNAGGIARHPRVPGLWFFGHEKFGAFRSRDDGATWTMVNEGLPRYFDRHGICFAFDREQDATVYYGADGGLFKSTDCGDHWVKCTQGLPSGKSRDKFGNTTVNNLVTHPITGAVYAGFYAVGYAEVPGIYRSTDHGATWACINHNFDGGVDQQASAALIRKLKEINKEKASAELNADYEKVLKGEPLDGGFMKGWTFDLKMAATNPDLLFAATSNVLIKSTDAGESWRTCATVQHPRAVAIHPQDPQIVVASGTYQVWLTRDGGTNWADVTRDLGNPPADAPQNVPHTQFLTFDPAGQQIYALGTGGVWVARLEEFQP